MSLYRVYKSTAFGHLGDLEFKKQVYAPSAVAALKKTFDISQQEYIVDYETCGDYLAEYQLNEYKKIEGELTKVSTTNFCRTQKKLMCDYHNLKKQLIE